MSSLIELFSEIGDACGLGLPSTWRDLDEISFARIAMTKLNEYFYQTYDGIGHTSLDDEEFQYFSEFHKYWEANHATILNARIDDVKADAIARAIIDAISVYGAAILSIDVNTHELPARAIAQVRFLTANQDFRTPPEEPYAKYIEDPERFDAQEIYDDPEGFLRFLNVTRLSQTDKRVDFARNAAKFLIDRQITAYDISSCFAYDVERIRSALTETPNMGYGQKKANMFLRDMVELGVWSGLSGIESIDVASDINTMKVALRTGLIRTDIPVLSSFLDIFCHQYDYIDQMNAKAWRRVWQKWRDKRPDSVPPSPSCLDHLVYRIGKDYCKPLVAVYKCGNGHVFSHFGGRLKLCPVCREMKTRSQATVIERKFPCQLEPCNLPRKEGRLLLKTGNFLKLFDGRCVLAGVCNPNSKDFIPLEPPKSISIKGQTSWTSAYSYRGRGGGGMMS